jgi:hypothetical protein
MWVVLTLTAWGSTPPHLMLVDTPYGPVDWPSLTTLCQMERIFIGKISSTTPYPKNSGWGAGQIFSSVTFQVERNVRGSGASFSWDQPGGRLGNTEVRVGGWPFPVEGARYLMALTTAKQTVGDIDQGDWLMGANLWIAPGVSLPSAAQLTSTLDEVCATL